MELQAKQRLSTPIEAADIHESVDFLRKFFKQHLGKFKPQVSSRSNAKTPDVPGRIEAVFSIEDGEVSLEINLGQPGRGSENQTWTALYLNYHLTVPISYQVERNLFPAHSQQGAELDASTLSELSEAAKFWVAYGQFMAAFTAAMKDLLKITKKNDPKEEPDF